MPVTHENAHDNQMCEKCGEGHTPEASFHGEDSVTALGCDTANHPNQLVARVSSILEVGSGGKPLQSGGSTPHKYPCN